MSAWKVILATLIIFGAGVMAGVMVTKHSVQPDPDHVRPLNVQNTNPWQLRNRELLRRMDRELALSTEQHARIEKIISASSDRTRNLWKPITQEMGRETQNVCEEIRNELTPEQRVKFDQISKAREERGERGRRGGHPPTFGPDGPTNHQFTNPAQEW